MTSKTASTNSKTPPKGTIAPLSPLDFAAIILELALHFKFSVTSWGRTAKRNKAVGGHPASRHLRWLAVDVVLDNAKDKPFFLKVITEAGLSFLDEGDHIHVQTKKGSK